MTGSTSQNTENKAKPQYLGLRRCCHCGLWLGFLLLVLIAVGVAAGRLLMPLIAGEKGSIEARLTEVLGTEVSIGTLNGRWFRLSPLLALGNLDIKFSSAADPTQELSHRIQNLNLEIDLFASVIQRELVIKEISVEELVFEFVEDQEGRWSVAGLAGGGDYSEQIINLILNISNLTLSETSLVLRRASGSVIHLNNAYLELQNSLLGHDVQLQVRLENQASPILFSLEIEGDLRDQFSASAYIVLNNIDFTGLLTASITDELSVSRLSSSAQIWLNYTAEDGLKIHGGLDDVNFVAQATSSELGIDISNGSIDITALQGANRQWQLWLQQPQFDFFNRPWETANFFLELDLQNEMPRLELVSERIDLGMLNNMLSMMSLPEAGQQVLEQLHPSGVLSKVKFNTDFSTGFNLAANLEDVAVGAWSAAPAISGINGYVQANQVSGFVELDSKSLDLYLPRVFKDGWHYDSINSRVHWYITEDLLRVNSSVIDVQTEGIHSRVQFDLYNTPDPAGGWDSELTILVGALEFDVSQKSLYLPTLESIESTMSWLDRALLAGDVSDSGFVFRGRVDGDAPGSTTIQTFYNVENARLGFLPDWPQLENISAFVKVSNNDVDVHAKGGQISGIELGPTVATLRLNEQSEGAWLTVSGNSQTSTAIGLDFIRNSPVRNSVGDYIDNWRAEGQISVDIELGIPIDNAKLENDIYISVLSDDSILELPDYALTFKELRGRVDYSNKTGLAAEALSGSLFDFPLASSIETFSEPVPGSSQTQAGIRIVSTGRASVAALQNWQGQSEFVKELLGFTQGEIDYQSEFELFSTQNQGGVLSRLSLSSNLPGLAIDLPAPFTKAIDEARKLAVEIEFLQDRDIFNILYDDNFSALMLYENETLSGGQLFFGPLNQSVAIQQEGSNRESLQFESGLSVRGKLNYYNYEAWSDVTQRFESGAQNSSQAQADFDEAFSFVDVDIASLDVFGVELFQVSTQIARSEVAPGWNVQLQNDLLGGSFSFPDDELEPFDIQLDYLRFSEVEAEVELETTAAAPEEEVDLLADIDPSELPNFNFTTLELSIGERNLGAWSFALRTNGSGATISNLIMNTEDARITDLAAESGANLDWRYNNGVHTSSFNGLLHADDLAQVLPSWGLDANVQSESADFISNLQWSGSPAAFSIVNSSGQVQVDIRNGRFVDINADTARLFAAFNFDAIVRRLQLDFSDLYKKGLAYDEISGKLIFDEGTVKTDGQVLIRGTSSTINIDGEIDLENETIDADMLVNIPLSQNITVIAGILGAWPVAVGTYLASKIFKDQFDGFTTVLYRLEGPWASLSAGFEADDEAVEAEMERAGVK